MMNANNGASKTPGNRTTAGSSAPLDLTEALNAIAQAIVSRVQDQLATTSVGVRPRLLDVEAAGIYLGRPERSIRGLVTGGKLPVVRIDGRVQFDVRDLDRVIENSKGDVKE